MRITEKKTITKEIDVTTDILCNKCGESIYKPNASYVGDPESTFRISSGPNLVEHTLCYLHSTTKFSVCEECLKEFMGSFKIPPTEEWQTIIG